MATLYNQYIYKNGAWMKIGTSSDSVTYTLSYSALTGLLTLTGSDGSTSTVTIESGSSDAITGITVNGTTVTVTDGVAAISIPTNVSAFTNDAGYLTSYTETDPVFSASAAAGITATDISNWNNKSNTDTKNTAGSTNSTSTLFLVGATAQAANPQTYSNSGLYYSGGLNSTSDKIGGRSTYTEIIQTYTDIRLVNHDGVLPSTALKIGQSTTDTSVSISVNDTDYIKVNHTGTVMITGIITPTNATDAVNK